MTLSPPPRNYRRFWYRKTFEIGDRGHRRVRMMYPGFFCKVFLQNKLCQSITFSKFYLCKKYPVTMTKRGEGFCSKRFLTVREYLARSYKFENCSCCCDLCSNTSRKASNTHLLHQVLHGFPESL